MKIPYNHDTFVLSNQLYIFDVQHVCAGIPTLVILDKEGKLVNSSGRVAIKIDPDGKVCCKTFSWTLHVI